MQRKKLLIFLITFLVLFYFCKHMNALLLWKSDFKTILKLGFHQFRLFVTPRTIAHQASLSVTNSRSLLKLMPIESVIPSNYLILCCPLLLLPSIFPSIRIFSNELVLCIRWPKYWSFSFSINPSNEYSGLISFRMEWLALLEFKGLSRVFSNTTVQKHQFFSAKLSLWSRQWHPTPVLLPGKSHGPRSLVGCRLWGR